MKTEFASLRREMDTRFDKVDARFDKMESRFDKVDARFDKIDDRFEAIQRLILQVGGGMIGTLALGVLTVLAARL